MSKEEKLKLFIDGVLNCVDYWINLKKEIVQESMKATGASSEVEYRCKGLAFSLLVMLDGDSGANDCHAYGIFDEEDEINDNVYLHDLYSARQDEVRDENN